MVPFVLFVVGVAVLVGFGAHLLFSRTKVPEVLYLIAAGVVLGPGLGIVSQSTALEYASAVTAVMLIVVMLDNGLEFNLFKVVKALPMTVAFSLGVMLATAAALAAVMHWMLGIGALPAAILSFAMAGTTTDVITAITSKMRLRHDTKQLLAIESVVNDLQIVPFFVLLHYAETASVNAVAPLIAVFVQIPLAILLGAGLAVIWISAIGRSLGRHPLNYVATIGLLLVVYGALQAVGGNGPLGVLAFSLVLGNGKEVFKRLHTRPELQRKFTDGVIKQVKEIEEDISFLVRVVFFVLLGVVFSFGVLQPAYLQTSAVLIAAMLVVRYAGARLLARKARGFRKTTGPLTWIMPRGYVAAVLAFAALGSGLFSAELANLVILYIFATTVISIVYAVVWERRRPKLLGEAEA